MLQQGGFELYLAGPSLLCFEYTFADPDMFDQEARKEHSGID